MQALSLKCEQFFTGEVQKGSVVIFLYMSMFLFWFVCERGKKGSHGFAPLMCVYPLPAKIYISLGTSGTNQCPEMQERKEKSLWCAKDRFES